MCRLYGFRANEATKVECALVLAQNSLLAQSRADLQGSDHSDGWGIAYYENGEPTLVRRATAAWEDLRFSVASERVFARTVLAHIRNATVGVPEPANTHPYALDRWSYAHNGTVSGFEELADTIREQTAERLRPLRRGTNDSEAAFYWLLTRLEERGLDLDGEPSLDELLTAFGDAVTRLVELCRSTGADRPPKLNFLLTDGRLMVASRWHRTLHWVERVGVHDCEICGTPHIHHEEETDYRAVVVASEPITDEPWRAVPDGCLLGIDADLSTRIVAIGQATPSS
jgi:glutamine amidotransferase